MGLQRKKKVVYMAVDLDEYELPYAVADSSKELAEICGTKANTVASAICHVEAGRAKRSRFIRVEIEEDDDEHIHQ